MSPLASFNSALAKHPCARCIRRNVACRLSPGSRKCLLCGSSNVHCLTPAASRRADAVSSCIRKIRTELVRINRLFAEGDVVLPSDDNASSSDNGCPVSMTVATAGPPTGSCLTPDDSVLSSSLVRGNDVASLSSVERNDFVNSSNSLSLFFPVLQADPFNSVPSSSDVLVSSTSIVTNDNIPNESLLEVSSNPPIAADSSAISSGLDLSVSEAFDWFSVFVGSSE